MGKKAAFITGASRGIDAESAVAPARAGLHVTITAGTLGDGETHDHVGHSSWLPGSLQRSAAARGRMAGSLRAEHPDTGLCVYNLEPGLVLTGIMKLAGIDAEVIARFKPCSPAAVAKELNLLESSSLLER